MYGKKESTNFIGESINFWGGITPFLTLCEMDVQKKDYRLSKKLFWIYFIAHLDYILF